MKLVITGALGHIGSALLRQKEFLASFSTVVLVDNLSTMRLSSLFNLPSDVTDFDFVNDSCANAMPAISLSAEDVILHLAATTDAAASIGKFEEIMANNGDSTKACLSASEESGARLVFPSSTSVYGSQDQEVDELSLELNPQSPYAEVKLREEQEILTNVSSDVNARVLRFGTIAGFSVGMRFHTAVNRFCWQASYGEPVEVWRTALHQKRPYLHIKDACRALAWAATAPREGPKLFNVLSENATVSQILGYIQDFGVAPAVKLVDHEIMNQLSYTVSAARAAQYGFRPEHSLKSGIFEVLEALALRRQ